MPNEHNPGYQPLYKAVVGGFSEPDLDSAVVGGFSEPDLDNAVVGGFSEPDQCAESPSETAPTDFVRRLLGHTT